MDQIDSQLSPKPPPVTPRPTVLKTSLRVTLAFLLFGILWVVVTDQLLEILSFSVPAAHSWQTYKGWLFIIASAGFIYALLRREEIKRGRLRKSLVETETFYRLLFDSNPLPMWAYDSETLNFLLVNDAAVQIYGYSRAEFFAMTLYDIRPAEDAERLRQDLATAAPVQNFAGEWRHRKKDGTVFPVEITSHAIKLRGRPARLVVASDISERKRAEQTVRLQAAALEAAANGIIITDTQGLIEWSNAAFAHMTGYQPDEIAGSTLRSLVHSGHHDVSFYRDLWTTILAGKVWHGELINRRKDGSLYTEEQTITPVPNMQGEITHFVAIKQDVTERRSAEITLRESEERYRNLFSNNQSVMLLIEPISGQIIDANPAAASYYRWSIQELRGMKISQISGASDEQGRREQEKLERRSHFTSQHRRADGSVRDTEVFSGPIPYEGRTLFYLIVHDITERTQNERELRAVAAISAALGMARRKSEMLPIILDELMVLLEVEGTAVATPDPRDGVLCLDLGRGVWARASGWKVPLNNHMFSRVRETGNAYLTNQPQRDADILGPELLVECRALAAVPLTVEDEFSGVLAIASKRPLQQRDVQLLSSVATLAASAIRRAGLHDQMQSQAEQLAQIMNSVPEGVLLLDQGYRIVMTNPVANRYLERFGSFSAGDVLPALDETALPALLTSPPEGGWHQVRRSGRTYEIIARPVEAGLIAAGWVMVIRDITENLSVQHQLQRQERLAATGQLAAGIAHDFNNLMSVILLYSQMLQQENGISERQRTRLQIIEEQGLRATRMIRQILDFSRRSVLERQQVDLLPLLHEQVKLLQHTLRENIEIAFTCAEDDYVVKADPTRIEQMVTNLAVNARDAMPDGGTLHIDLRRIQVSARTKPPLVGMAAGDWIRLTVSDTGVGITPDVLEHVFEPFFTTKEPGQGTGLGLAQVHGIVGQHEGQITVESQPGIGTTFRIYLPALALVGDKMTRQRDIATLHNGHGERVLIVEDNIPLRNSLNEVLQLWNYRTQAAANGEEALDLFKDGESSVDLIITDVVMPKLGGIGLFMRLHSAGCQVPTIFISGHPLHEELVELRKLGRLTMLPKPISFEQLARAIDLLLTPLR